MPGSDITVSMGMDYRPMLASMGQAQRKMGSSLGSLGKLLAIGELATLFKLYGNLAHPLQRLHDAQNQAAKSSQALADAQKRLQAAAAGKAGSGARLDEAIKGAIAAQKEYDRFKRLKLSSAHKETKETLLKSQKELKYAFEASNKSAREFTNAGVRAADAEKEMAAAGSDVATASALMAAEIALAVIAVIALGAELIKKEFELAEYGRKLENIGRISRLTTQNIVRMNQMAFRTGMGFEEAAGALENYRNKLWEATRLGGDANTAMMRLGLNAAELSRMPLAQSMEILVNQLNSLDNVLERDAIAAQIFGANFRQILLMQKGDTAIAARFMAAYGDQIAEASKAASQLSNRWEGFKRQASDILWLRAMQIVQPLLEDMMDILESLTPVMLKFADAVGFLAKNLFMLDPTGLSQIFHLTTWALKKMGIVSSGKKPEELKQNFQTRPVPRMVFDELRRIGGGMMQSMATIDYGRMQVDEQRKTNSVLKEIKSAIKGGTTNAGQDPFMGVPAGAY